MIQTSCQLLVYEIATDSIFVIQGIDMRGIICVLHQEQKRETYLITLYVNRTIHWQIQILTSVRKYKHPQLICLFLYLLIKYVKKALVLFFYSVPFHLCKQYTASYYLRAIWLIYCPLTISIKSFFFMHCIQQSFYKMKSHRILVKTKNKTTT